MARNRQSGNAEHVDYTDHAPMAPPTVPATANTSVAIAAANAAAAAAAAADAAAAAANAAMNALDPDEWVTPRDVLDIIEREHHITISRSKVIRACIQRRHRMEGRNDDAEPIRRDRADTRPDQLPGELICHWNYLRSTTRPVGIHHTPGAWIHYSVYRPSIEPWYQWVTRPDREEKRGWKLGRPRKSRKSPKITPPTEQAS